ncbi:MAG: ABC transporter ATP-binding protein, partial [Actinomycetota bacterium]
MSREASVLRLENLVKRFDDGVAVDDISLEVAAGELLALVGPSGCGKSTLLRLIAGLSPPDSGRVLIDGREVAGPGTWVPAERRGVGMVFQDHALFPHLSVRDNVAFGLARRAPGRRARIDEVLDLVGLGSLAERFPHELSGGEVQRVALARALAPEPAVVLLDEPFSDLDRNLRTRVRDDVVGVLRTAGTTGVFVTHDQEEALAVGDRVAVACAGRLEQVGLPETVFHAPATRFVATFMGEADFLPGRRDGTTAATPWGTVPVLVPEPGGALDAAGVDVMVRPDDVHFSPDPAGAAVVRRAEFRGSFVVYHLDL